MWAAIWICAQVYVATICNASVFYDIFIASSVCIIYNAGIVFHLAKYANSCGTCVFLFLNTWHMENSTENTLYIETECVFVWQCRIDASVYSWQGIFKSHSLPLAVVSMLWQLCNFLFSPALEPSSVARGFCQFANGNVSHSIWNCHNHWTHTPAHTPREREREKRDVS